jgi:putative nucleotidyltransferase with HDIG domain
MSEPRQHDDEGPRTALERELRGRLRDDETRYASSGDAGATDTLWDHSLRVARLAAGLGREEGIDPDSCRLAGLFHDAGKFAEGRYHDDDLPEEQRSVGVLEELATAHGLAGDQVAAVSEAILQLYRDDPQPTSLARVLFDADNLDKLGPLGVANYFTKAGLRGHAVSRDVLLQATVELTYARCAPRSLYTAAGRRRATHRGAQTEAFFRQLLDTLRDDGLHDLTIEEIDHQGLPLVVVTPPSCRCGGPLQRTIWESPGMKCTRVHLRHACKVCEQSHELAFCRPRLLGVDENPATAG